MDEGRWTLRLWTCDTLMTDDLSCECGGDWVVFWHGLSCKMYKGHDSPVRVRSGYHIKNIRFFFLSIIRGRWILHIGSQICETSQTLGDLEPMTVFPTTRKSSTFRNNGFWGPVIETRQDKTKQNQKMSHKNKSKTDFPELKTLGRFCWLT